MTCPHHVAVFAMCVSVSWFVTTELVSQLTVFLIVMQDFFFCNPPADGENKAHHTSTYFYTGRVSI